MFIHVHTHIHNFRESKSLEIDRSTDFLKIFSNDFREVSLQDLHDIYELCRQNFEDSTMCEYTEIAIIDLEIEKINHVLLLANELIWNIFRQAQEKFARVNDFTSVRFDDLKYDCEQCETS